jgi:hypothetical protein
MEEDLGNHEQARIRSRAAWRRIDRVGVWQQLVRWLDSELQRRGHLT